MKVEIWSDIACPWCYIGKKRFEKAVADYGGPVEVTYRSYQLDPTLPAYDPRNEVDYLVQSKGMRRDEVQAMVEHVAQQAAGEGLKFDFDQIVVANSFTAHRLLQHAKVTGAMAQLKEALLAAHFEQGRDIGDPDTLVELAASVGLDPGEAREVLVSKRYTDEVREDIAEARRIGVTGVPFYVFEDAYAVSGAQPPEVFLDVLRQVEQLTRPQPVALPGSPAAEVCGPDGCALPAAEDPDPAARS